MIQGRLDLFSDPYLCEEVFQVRVRSIHRCPRLILRQHKHRHGSDGSLRYIRSLVKSHEPLLHEVSNAPTIEAPVMLVALV